MNNPNLPFHKIGNVNESSSGVVISYFVKKMVRVLPLIKKIIIRFKEICDDAVSIQTSLEGSTGHGRTSKDLGHNYSAFNLPVICQIQGGVPKLSTDVRLKSVFI